MLDREPFLKAIYADRDNDLPRLVFADWLDDHDDHEWAELIRVQCDTAQRRARCDDPAVYRAVELEERRWDDGQTYVRGFSDSDMIFVHADVLSDPDRFRRLACERHPHWYGATVLVVNAGRLVDPSAVVTMLTSPVTERVDQLLLQGREEQLGTAHDEQLGVRLIDFDYKPVITTRMVEHLCGMREARRLTNLDLSCNDLDNDAVRALIRSTNLIRLRSLTIQQGNTRVKGRLWGELRQRFGEEAVS